MERMNGVPDKSGVKTMQQETVTMNEIIQYLQLQKRFTIFKSVNEKKLRLGVS